MAIILVAVVATIFGLASCLNSQRNYTGKAESVTIGMEATAVNSLIYIAENQNYFAANGLNVIIKDYASGLAAVNGMLNNEVDIATAAEFVIVGKALTNERIRTVGSIDKFRHNYLIGRKDRGIENVADLEGKKVGLPLKTAAEFYLGRFLELQGMHIQQVTLVDVSPPKLVDALLNGEVDAVIAWQPNARSIEDRLGNGIVKWPAQSEQATYCSVISTDAWIAAHPELADRFLNSLAQAEAYLIRRPAEARAIVQKRLKYEDAYIATIWPEHQFSLSLDQSLILALEDEARWMINNALTDEKKTPDFLDYIYVAGLEEIKPEAVNIIR